MEGFLDQLGSIDWGYWIGTIIAILLVITGLIGSLVPVLPGNPLIAVAGLIYAFVTNFREITWTVLIALIIIAVVSQILGYLASSYGAKKFGSSGWGVAGAIIGSIVGIFVGGPIGLAIFPFVFAFLFELIAARSTAKKSARVAFGSLIGVLGGIVMQFSFGVVMVVTMLVAIL